VALLDGLTFHYRPYDTALGAMVAHVGAYETEVARAIERLLPSGGTFVDVGANIGLHAIRAARAVGAGGTVICFEPNPGNVELLTLTMTANQFDQVTIRPVAASDRPGVVPLHARRGQSNGTVEEGTIRWPSDVQVDVPSARLDDELAGIDRLDLLKIDIEGAEPLAFAGMAETLARFKPPILMEVFPDALRRTSGVEPAAFLEHVASIGYQMLPMIPGQGEPNEVRSIESILALPVEHSVTHVDVLAVPS
jgi:FkbM family methyltransferase